MSDVGERGEGQISDALRIDVANRDATVSPVVTRGISVQVRALPVPLPILWRLVDPRDGPAGGEVVLIEMHNG